MLWAAGLGTPSARAAVPGADAGGRLFSWSCPQGW